MTVLPVEARRRRCAASCSPDGRQAAPAAAGARWRSGIAAAAAADVLLRLRARRDPALRIHREPRRGRDGRRRRAAVGVRRVRSVFARGGAFVRRGLLRQIVAASLGQGGVVAAHRPRTIAAFVVLLVVAADAVDGLGVRPAARLHAQARPARICASTTGCSRGSAGPSRCSASRRSPSATARCTGCSAACRSTSTRPVAMAEKRSRRGANRSRRSCLARSGRADRDRCCRRCRLTRTSHWQPRPPARVPPRVHPDCRRRGDLSAVPAVPAAVVDARGGRALLCALGVVLRARVRRAASGGRSSATRVVFQERLALAADHGGAVLEDSGRDARGITVRSADRHGDASHVDTAGAASATTRVEIPFLAAETAATLAATLYAHAAQTAFRW